MRETSILTLILILLGISLIAGCGGGRRAQDDPAMTFNPTGTEGLVVNFVQNQPPAKMYTGTPMTIVAEVANKGTYDIQHAEIFVSGFDPNIIRIAPGQGSVDGLEGRSAFNPYGDLDSISIESQPISLPAGTASYSPNIMLSSCFLYETIANPMSCVDNSPHLLSEDKACTVTNLATGGSQGAPIAVTTVEAQATPTEMVYRIHISNVGGGQVYDTASISNCPFELQYSDLDKIHVKEVMLGSTQPTECKPSNPVRLVNGQATIFCKFAQPGGPAFETPLNIKLEYGYKNSVQRHIEIQNLQQ